MEAAPNTWQILSVESIDPRERKSWRQVPGGPEATDLERCAAVALLKPCLFGKAKTKPETQVSSHAVWLEVQGIKQVQEPIVCAAPKLLTGKEMPVL